MRYNALLEGLEIAEIKLTDLERTFRIDSEFFLKKYIEVDKKLYNIKTASLANYVFISDGNHMSIADSFSEEGIPYYRGQDVHSFFIENANPICIPEVVYNIPNMSRSHLQKGDVLLSIVGTIGKLSLVNTNIKQTCSCKLAILRPKPEFRHPEFVAGYLSSKYGQLQINRLTRGAVQMGLILEDIDQIFLPFFSDPFISKVASFIKEAENTLSDSKYLYTQATELLEETLGLKNWQPSTENINVQRFSNSLAATGRIDAEYYQPKYNELEEKLSKFKMYAVKDIISYPVSSGSTPKAGGDDYTDKQNGVPFIRAVDLNNSIVMTDNFIYVKKGIHNGLLKRTQIKKNDVLFSIAGTVGRTAVFLHDFEANINQAVAILRFDESVFKRFYVTTFFNSRIGKIYIEKYSRQGLQTNLNLEEVSELKIPCIEFKKQIEIAGFIEQAIELKEQSTQLLEQAKQAVEIAIEQGEEAAMKFLEN